MFTHKFESTFWRDFLRRPAMKSKLFLPPDWIPIQLWSDVADDLVLAQKKNLSNWGRATEMCERQERNRTIDVRTNLSWITYHLARWVLKIFFKAIKISTSSTWRCGFLWALRFWGRNSDRYKFCNNVFVYLLKPVASSLPCALSLIIHFFCVSHVILKKPEGGLFFKLMSTEACPQILFELYKERLNYLSVKLDKTGAYRSQVASETHRYHCNPLASLRPKAENVIISKYSISKWPERKR